MKHSRQQLSYTLPCCFFLICNQQPRIFSQVVAFVPFIYLYVSPFITSCSLGSPTSFVFSAAIPTWTILFFAFPIPRSNFETTRDSIFPSPIRPEVVSVLPLLSLPRCSSKRVDPPGCLCVCSACVTSSPLKCSILNVSSHEFSVAHRKAGQTLTRYYTPGSRIGLRSLKSRGRRQRPSPQRGSGLRSRRTFPTLLAEPVRCILSLSLTSHWWSQTWLFS